MEISWVSQEHIAKAWSKTRYWDFDWWEALKPCSEMAQGEWYRGILDWDYGFLRPFLMEAEHVFNMAHLDLFKEFECC